MLFEDSSHGFNTSLSVSKAPLMLITQLETSLYLVFSSLNVLLMFSKKANSSFVKSFRSIFLYISSKRLEMAILFHKYMRASSPSENKYLKIFRFCHIPRILLYIVKSKNEIDFRIFLRQFYRIFPLILHQKIISNHNLSPSFFLFYIICHRMYRIRRIKKDGDEAVLIW